MAAWVHYRWWTNSLYEHDYRDFVRQNGSKFKGLVKLPGDDAVVDCADISMTLLIDFAASKGLPTTFEGNDGTLFISKAGFQQNRSGEKPFNGKDWGNNDKAGYAKAVRHRINVNALLLSNNTDRKPQGLPPEPGDLLIKGPHDGHAALIIATYGPGQPHPKANQFQNPIPLYPGPDQAKAQLTVLEYFSNDPRQPSLDIHFDYLNHRGEGIQGAPKKEAKELIYFATLNDNQVKDFQLRVFNQKVLESYRFWDGEGKLPLGILPGFGAPVPLDVPEQSPIGHLKYQIIPKEMPPNRKKIP